jgi:hypothetical protein
LAFSKALLDSLKPVEKTNADASQNFFLGYLDRLGVTLLRQLDKTFFFFVTDASGAMLHDF